jgi:hypothetical protein
MLDLFLGSTSVLMDHDPTSLARKKLYGGAGNHRWCPAYGVEYRTLSNFWLRSPSMVRLMYNLSELVMKLVDCDKANQIWAKINPLELRHAINEGNSEEILKSFYPLITEEMDYSLRKRVESMFEPINSDFYKEWKL